MKGILVYFSLDGNTRLVCEKIAASAGMDTLELIPVKPFPSKGILKMLVAGRAAIKGKRSKLKNYNFNPKDYDFIIIGGPVWAASPSPPINAFLSENSFFNKKVALLACESSGGSDRMFSKIEQMIPDANIISTLTLISPKTKDTEAQLEQAITWAKFLM